MSGPATNRFVESGRYVSGYLNAGQPIPAIGLGAYGVAPPCSREGGVAALGAGFAVTGFLTDFPMGGFFAPTDGFFAAFFGVLFFVGFAMPRNLPHAPTAVKPNGSLPGDAVLHGRGDRAATSHRIEDDRGEIGPALGAHPDATAGEGGEVSD